MGCWITFYKGKCRRKKFFPCVAQKFPLVMTPTAAAAMMTDGFIFFWFYKEKLWNRVGIPIHLNFQCKHCHLKSFSFALITPCSKSTYHLPSTYLLFLRSFQKKKIFLSPAHSFPHTASTTRKTVCTVEYKKWKKNFLKKFHTGVYLAKKISM